MVGCYDVFLFFVYFYEMDVVLLLKVRCVCNIEVDVGGLVLG